MKGARRSGFQILREKTIIHGAVARSAVAHRATDGDEISRMTRNIPKIAAIFQ
jgi:hypothetical protein